MFHGTDERIIRHQQSLCWEGKTKHETEHSWIFNILKNFSKSDFSGFRKLGPQTQTVQNLYNTASLVASLTPNKILMFRILIPSSELSTNVYEIFCFSHAQAVGIIYEVLCLNEFQQRESFAASIFRQFVTVKHSLPPHKLSSFNILKQFLGQKVCKSCHRTEIKAANLSLRTFPHLYGYR